MKRDLDEVSLEQMERWSATAKQPFDDETLDKIEMAVYGDVKRADPGPFPPLVTTSTICRCKSLQEMTDAVNMLSPNPSFQSSKATHSAHLPPC
jgi:hypothetical protein